MEEVVFSSLGPEIKWEYKIITALQGSLGYLYVKKQLTLFLCFVFFFLNIPGNFSSYKNSIIKEKTDKQKKFV